MEDEQKQVTPVANQAPQPTSQDVQPKVPRYVEAYKKYNPDSQFDNDQDAENAFYEDYDTKNAQIGEMVSQNKEVAEAIMSEPTLTEIISDVVQGVPFEVALAKNVDLEAVKPLEGEPNYDDYNKAVAERKKRQEEVKIQRQTIENNLLKMQATAEEFFTEENIEDDQRQAYVDFIDGIVSEVLNGTFSKQSFKKMLQAFKYEDDIAAATEQGAVAGRNQQIEAKRQINAATDGLPNNTASVAPQTAPQTRKVFDI